MTSRYGRQQEQIYIKVLCRAQELDVIIFLFFLGLLRFCKNRRRARPRKKRKIITSSSCGAEYVANTQKHFRNNRRPLSRMYLEKHQIEVTTPRFSSLYYKSTSKYMLNQIAEMLHVCICDSSVDPKFKIFYRPLPSGGKY